MNQSKDHIQNLLFEKLSGTISKSDERFIDDLLQHDIEVMDMWRNINSAFDSIPGAAFIDNLDADQAFNQLKKRVKLKPRGQSYYKIAIAASVIAIFGIGFYFSQDSLLKDPPLHVQTVPLQGVYLKNGLGEIVNLPYIKDHKNELGSQNMKENGQLNLLVVPAKFDYTVILSDGSSVKLNSSSTLRFPTKFGSKKREVYLTGEGYFEVAKLSGAPFYVHANQTTIQVLGTKFNVNSYKHERTVTSLVEGSVKLTLEKQNTYLKPGFQATVNGKVLNITAFEPSTTLSWMKGIHEFHNVPLKEIAEIIPRWFNVKVVFKTYSRVNDTFSGSIDKSKPLHVFLKNLELTGAIKTKMVDNTLYIL